jgi:hypothetical protein
VACGAHYFNQTTAKLLLSDKHLYFMGDSIARLLMMGLMRSIGWDEKMFTFDRHSDFEVEVPVGKDINVTFTFAWRPFPNNVTQLLRSASASLEHADMIFVSTSLWHMLHIADAEDYRQQMALLHSKVKKSLSKQCPTLATVSEVHQQRLSLHKRATMMGAAVDAYNQALDSSAVFSTFNALDMFSLTHGKKKP